MFQIEDDMTIHITRGDVAYFTVTAENDGEKYIFQPNDILRMKVFKKKDATSVAFQKTFLVTEEAERVDILLTEEETKIGDVISKPVDYWYEIELNPYTNPQTIIGYDEDGPKIFKVYPEGRDFPSVDAKDIPVIDSELDLTSERPVQNQAIARALIGYEDRVSEAIKKVNDAAEGVETELETFATDLVTETKESLATEIESALEEIQGATDDAEAFATRAEEAASRAEAVVGTDFTDILNGTVPVGDSKKLNGKSDTDFLSINGGTLNGALITGNNRIATSHLDGYSDSGSADLHLNYTNQAAQIYAYSGGKSGTVIHSGNVGEHALPLTGGTMSGMLKANENSMANTSASQVRDIVIVDTAPEEGSTASYPNGTIVFSKAQKE